MENTFNNSKWKTKQKLESGRGDLGRDVGHVTFKDKVRQVPTSEKEKVHSYGRSRTRCERSAAHKSIKGRIRMGRKGPA